MSTSQFFSDDVVFDNRFSFPEAGQAQRADIQRMGLSIQDLFSQEESTSRAMHEPMTREPVDQEEALHFRNPSEDRMGIGTDLIEARPPIADPHLFEKGHPLHGGIDVDEFPLAVHVLVEPGGSFRFDMPVRMEGPSRWK